MDQAYHNAVKRKKWLEEQLREVETFLSLYRQFSADAGRKESVVPSQEDSNGVDLSHAQQKKPRRTGRRRGTPAAIANMAEIILLSHNRPMTRGELVVEMEKAGVIFPVADKAKYVGTVLWRKSDRFENLDRQGYWVRGVEPGSAQTKELLERSIAAIRSQ